MITISLAIIRENYFNIKHYHVERLLEPCVTGRRHSKTTCANLLLQAGIKHVIIGMLDPDSRIRGKGEGLFRKNGGFVYYFPTELRTALENLNAEFIEEKEKGQFRAIFHYNN